ncbi:hypothetical protein pdam_00002796 [Pocillopora damicornis]|uniref:Uncharacterized protein n=1 Tax=Pocillopora damicornis TaxID=46731 RepID=A0A3M6TT95_POCDA|nr:hypothetical protein pdam_00002796 [Pocillopora damicornis]
MDRAKSEGDVKLVVVSITMDGREMLRNNVEEAGDEVSTYYFRVCIKDSAGYDGQRSKVLVDYLYKKLILSMFFSNTSYVRSIFVSSAVVTFRDVPNLRKLTIHGPGFIAVPTE